MNPENIRVRKDNGFWSGEPGRVPQSSYHRTEDEKEVSPRTDVCQNLNPIW